jgi:hypothetical protein
MGLHGLYRDIFTYIAYWWERQKKKRPLGRPRRKCADNIKIDLTRDRMGWYGLDRSGSGKGPVEGFCEHGNEPSGSIKCWEVLE